MSDTSVLWTCRYQEYPPPRYRWWLNVYTDNPPFAHTPMTGVHESQQPAWLSDVLRTAVVGSHMVTKDVPVAPQPPNIRFVWFRVDKTGALHDFVKPSETLDV